MGAFFDAFRSKRVGLLIALGFASGMPLRMSGSTLTAWMTNVGVDLKTIGVFSLVSLPYSLQVLWAPLLDRYGLPWLGRRRGWMAATLIGLAAAIACMGLVDPRRTPVALAALALLVAFLSSSHDVVSNAYRADVLPVNERAAGSATFIMGYRLALLVSGAGALILADHVSWPWVFLLMAGLMAVGLIATWRAPEPEAIRPPRTLGEAVVKPFVDFFSRRGAILALAFVMLYKFGEYVADTMIVPFLLKTGFTNTDVGALQKGVGFAATVLGVLLGGGLVAKLGNRRALLLFGVLQAGANVGYLALAVVGKSYPLLVAAIAIDNVCNGMGTAALQAFMLSLCNKSFSAMQFALLSSATTLLGRTVGAGAGYLVTAVGWPTFFGISMAAIVPALALLALLPPEPRTAEAAPTAA